MKEENKKILINLIYSIFIFNLQPFLVLLVVGLLGFDPNIGFLNYIILGFLMYLSLLFLMRKEIKLRLQKAKEEELKNKNKKH